MSLIQNHSLDRDLQSKTCSKCKESKPMDQFATYTKKDREKPRECLRAWCKACLRSDRTEYRRREPSAIKQSKIRAYAKHKIKIDACNMRCRLKKQYGISMGDYERMHSRQGGKCAICGRPEETVRRSGEPRQLSVDHDHDTGAVRALLCHKCNAGIGFFRDDASLLREAIKYIERHSPVQGNESGSGQHA